MALSGADLGALVTALFNFLQNHPAVTPGDMRVALAILEKRQQAIDARAAANSDAQAFGLPAV